MPSAHPRHHITHPMNITELQTYEAALRPSGLYRLEATHFDNDLPTLNLYRKHPRDALRWMAKMVQQQIFALFVLRDSDGCIQQFYDWRGKPQGCGPSCSPAGFRGSIQRVRVCRRELIKEARHFTKEPELRLLACVEDHAGASAADHCNFVAVCRWMIAGAPTHDLAHVFVIESRRWPCPVIGLFANMEKLSDGVRNSYLGRVRWIQNSRPMVAKHHRATLADRLVKVRHDDVRDLLRRCGRAVRRSDDCISAMLVSWTLASPGAKYQFARHVVDTLKDGLIYKRNSAETFDPKLVSLRRDAILEAFDKRFKLSHLLN